MNDLLSNPAVQAAVAPFLAALVVSWVANRFRLLGMGAPVALAVVATLAIGFSFESLTASRKLVLLGLGSGLAGVLIALQRWTGARAGAVLAVLAGAGAVWMLARVLQQKEGAMPYVAGAAAGLYLAALVESGRRFAMDPVEASSAGMALGLGSGALALLGGSASLAQVGIAIGAGVGATLLVQMVTGRSPAPPWSLVLPASVVAGLVGLLSVFTGALPWYALAPALTVTWAASLFRGTVQRPAWLSAFQASALALLPMLLAVLIAWSTAGASST